MCVGKCPLCHHPCTALEVMLKLSLDLGLRHVTESRANDQWLSLVLSLIITIIIIIIFISIIIIIITIIIIIIIIVTLQHRNGLYKKVMRQ